MTPELVRDLLAEAGLAGRDALPVIEPLSGGVSSGIFKVVAGSRTYCVKQALPKLKVEKDWRVPTDRVFAEIAWLRQAAKIVPGHVPRVLSVSERDGAFIMDFLDEQVYRNWKTLLMQDVVQDAAAEQVASVLGRLHEATASDPDIREEFENASNFYLLRLEPYLVEAAVRNPDRSDELIELVHSVQHHRLALVHGDVSPKNIFLSDDGAVLLDAECACFSDPAFDLAFLLNHLFLKSVFRPRSLPALLRLLQRIWTIYRDFVTWEPKQVLETRMVRLLSGLMLARVDGKSPVEYLSAEQQSAVRKFARRALVQRHHTLAQLVEAWSAQ